MKIKNLIKFFSSLFKHDCENCSNCQNKYYDIKMVRKKDKK